MYFSGISDEAGTTIERQIAAHKVLGWTRHELRLVNGTNLTDVDDATFEHTVAVLEEAGMTVCSFASQLANWSRPITKDFAIDVEEMRRAIPRMQRLGTPIIRCMSYPNDGLTDEAWRDEAVRRLRELARMAEDGGVIIVHENCNGWGGESAANTLELLERVNSPAFKLVFDTGNPVAHDQDAYEFLRAVIDHVIHVHIKDGKKDGEKAVFTYCGDGTCRVRDCIRLLIEHGYDGGYSIEPHIAAIIHTGEVGGEEREARLYDSYIEYGRRLMKLYDEAGALATR